MALDKIKAFIIMRDRLTWPKAMAEYLSDTGCEVILMDNKSSYLPLLEWYKACPYKVHRLVTNRTTWVSWIENIISRYADRHFIVSDPDLDISQVPRDYVHKLMMGLNENQQVLKAGLSLEISDLPQNELTTQIVEHEGKFWLKRNHTGFYEADISTTFALYDRERLGGEFLNAVRADRPYTARHLPWHMSGDELFSNEEEKYYLTHSAHQSWGHLISIQVKKQL